MMARTNGPAALAQLGEVGTAERRDGSVRDYWIVLKPNVMQLVVFTGLVGLYVAPGHLHPVLSLTAVLCIAAAAGAAAAINNWYDADIDRVMGRTRLRPTAAGRVDPNEALALGVTLAILSVLLMGLALNWLAAGLLVVTIAYYVFVYTMWLKRRTAQNIVIGGAAGSFPPLIGWAAVTGSLDVLPILLATLIFLWTPPHFWALALARSGDYARVGVPMLPVVAGRERTRRDILIYAALLVPLSVAPWAIGEAGPLYGVISLALALVFLASAWRLWSEDTDTAAWATFRFSIVYLFLLFGGLALDSWVMHAGGWA